MNELFNFLKENHGRGVCCVCVFFFFWQSINMFSKVLSKVLKTSQLRYDKRGQLRFLMRNILFLVSSVQLDCDLWYPEHLRPLLPVRLQAFPWADLLRGPHKASLSFMSSLLIPRSGSLVRAVQPLGLPVLSDLWMERKEGSKRWMRCWEPALPNPPLCMHWLKRYNLKHTDFWFCFNCLSL